MDFTEVEASVEPSEAESASAPEGDSHSVVSDGGEKSGEKEKPKPAPKKKKIVRKKKPSE